MLDTLFDENTLDSVQTWFEDQGLVIIAILLIAYLVRHFGGFVIRRVVRSSVRKDHTADTKSEKQREDTIVSMISSFVNVLVWVVATILILDRTGVNIGAMLAGAGALGIVVGLGAQSLMKDLLSGIFIIMENQYRVGDIITISEKTGWVESINIRTTVLRDLDGNQHHVPNGSITTTTNMTKDYSNVNFDVGVAYDTDVEIAEKVINKIGQDMAKTKTWGEAIINPPAFLRVNSFGDSSVNIKILARVQPGMQWKVAGEFRKRLKVAFEKHKIEIPYPHRVVETRTKPAQRKHK